MRKAPRRNAAGLFVLSLFRFIVRVFIILGHFGSGGCRRLDGVVMRVLLVVIFLQAFKEQGKRKENRRAQQGNQAPERAQVNEQKHARRQYRRAYNAAYNPQNLIHIIYNIYFPAVWQAFSLTGYKSRQRILHTYFLNLIVICSISVGTLNGKAGR